MSRAHELALARMLAAYETRWRDTDVDVDTDVVDSRKVAQHVRAMRATLDGLVGTCDEAVRATYAERIARVETMATARGAMATTTTTAATTTTGGVGRRGDAKGDEGADASGGALRHRRAFAANGGANGVHRTSTGGGVGIAAAGPSANGRGGARSARDEEELEKQRAIREGLTDEMSALASGLKANALAMEKGLERSTKALEDVESKLERNVQGVKTSVKRQTAAYGANRRGSCWTWIILFVVGILFAWTYVVIKVSSDKTKISRAAAAAAAAAAARH